SESFSHQLQVKPFAEPFNAVFIRAPALHTLESPIKAPETDASEPCPALQVLARVPKTALPQPSRAALASGGAELGPDADVVMVRQGNVLASSFHPELTGDWRVHEVDETAHGAKSEETDGGGSAARFLMAQAEREQQAEQDLIQQRKLASDKQQAAASKEQAWDGDEPQDRMIRRILEDSYKPLRVKGYVKPTQQPLMTPSQIDASQKQSSSSKPPLEPWQHTYKAPDNWHDPLIVQPRFKSTGASGHTSTTKLATKAKGTMKTTLARQERLAQAWEKTLDYNAGIRITSSSSSSTRQNAKAETGVERQDRSQQSLGQMHAWGGFVEDRIQQAKKDGLFKNIKGRGKPLLRDLEAESNPFIPRVSWRRTDHNSYGVALFRDDFLINRIVQRQGVAPPWIELQQELESNLNSFRASVREAWFRRATRILSLEGNSSREPIKKIQNGWRDLDWERQERSFHQAAIHDLNQLTRRYNIQAPFHVRRGLLNLDNELQTILEKTRPAIVWELERRLQGGKVDKFKTVKIGDRIIQGDDDDGGSGDDGEGRLSGGEKRVVRDRMWPAFRRAVWEMLGIGQNAQVSASQR
ncbi:hypothetical protein OIV83_002316, partial [Microbotryomycetes sp. JL201]